MPPVACSLSLDACSLLLVAPDNRRPPARPRARLGSCTTEPRDAYSLFCSSMYFLDLSWSALTSLRISSIASAILFNCVVSIYILSKYILYYLIPAVKRCLLLEACRSIFSFFYLQAPLHTSGSMDHSTNRGQQIIAGDTLFSTLLLIKLI